MKTRSGNPFHARFHRMFAAALALCALVALALIPAGFMPSVTPDGKVAIVICSGVDSKTIYVDADQAPPAGPSHDGANDKASCPFMLAQASVTVPPLVIALPVVLALSTHSLPSTGTIPVRTAYLSSPPARGPPAVTSL